MKLTRRSLALLLVLLLTLGMLAGCAANKSSEEGLASAAWKLTGRTDRPGSVGCIYFNDPAALNSHMSMPEDSVVVLPNCGYAYVFAPNEGAVRGMYIVFLDDAGNMTAIMDYNALELSEQAFGADSPAQSSMYQNACNYMVFMYSDMLTSAVSMTADMRTNQWYVLTAEQIDAMMK